MRDEDNPQFIFSLTNTKLLMQIANDKLDSADLAKKELINRGIGKSGMWSGFSDATKQWSVQEKPPIKFVSQNVLDAWSESVKNSDQEQSFDYIKLKNGVMITVTEKQIRVFDSDDLEVPGSEVEFKNITIREWNGKE